LPTHQKEQIAGLRAAQAGLAYGVGEYLDAVPTSWMAIEPVSEAHTVQTHPSVIRHPRTGRSALYVNSASDDVGARHVAAPQGDP
jgi:alpha-ketoglutarate-dependent taurine dioxygenase